MQFGRALKRLITQIVRADPRFGPIYLIKVDVADGFYHVKLRQEDVPKLGVTFPPLPRDTKLHVAFPVVLPMGWTELPPYFCAITKTITGMANVRILKGEMPPPHRLEKAASSPPDLKAINVPACGTVATAIPTERDPLLPRNSHMLSAIDIFIDDFLGIAQGSGQGLHRVRRILLHAIDDIFHPLEPNDGPFRREPVSVKKLLQGDASWCTVKKILGWVIDTVAMTITLPECQLKCLANLLASIPLTQK